MTSTGNRSSLQVIQTVAVVAAIFGGASALADPSAPPEAEVRVVGTQLSLQPTVEFSQALVRVVGPAGFEAQRVFDGPSPMTLDLLLDGWLTVVAERDADAWRSEGVPRMDRVSPAVLPDGRYRYEAVLTVADRVGSSVRGSFLVEAGATRDLHAAGAIEPEDDASFEMPIAARADGEISAQGDFISDFVNITDVPNDGSTRLSLASETTGDAPLEWWDVQTEGGDFWICESGDDPGGCFSPRIVILDDVGGRVGIGTSAPATQLHLQGTSPELRIQDVGVITPGAWDLRASTGNLLVQDVTTGNLPMSIRQGAPGFSFAIASSGNVGLGTQFPAAKLDVRGDARVEGNVALGSSRTLKTAFDAVDSAEVLAKLTDLPVASWRYKTEDESTRHIGPFAEDFQRLFGLGDGETISLIDAQGVALAAIQGLDGRLDREVDDLRAAIASLTDSNLRLASENADLRERLESLEEVLGHLGAALSRHRQEPSDGLPSPMTGPSARDPRESPMEGERPTTH
jgi:hypothetical protein